MISMDNKDSIQYLILICQESLDRMSDYLERLVCGARFGNYLGMKLGEEDLSCLSLSDFIYHLINTKRPRIFAESEVRGDGSDWILEELRLLGDISVAVPVTVYDNGRHQNPDVHQEPFPATLIYTPGALLRNDRGGEPADWKEVTTESDINLKGYYRLYERRLLPGLRYASDQSGKAGKKALVTIPGIGCGQFAGPFRGELQEYLKSTLIRILETHRDKLPHLKTIYFDPYRVSQNERHEIDGISFLVRPLTEGNQDAPQLCPPTHYQEEGDDFADCDLYSVVAWDHVSWPGNDFYAGLRATDDGVKTAATDSMWKITGVEGGYDPEVNKYQQPPHYDSWEEVVKMNNAKLIVDKNLLISDTLLEIKK